MDMPTSAPDEQLAQAFALVVSYWQKPAREPEETFLARHAELRDLLVPMLREARSLEATALSTPATTMTTTTTTTGPERVGPYDLLRELGRGGQAIVYLAEDRRLHRKVALKMLTGTGLQSPAMRLRLQREAEALSRLDHPGICNIHEIGEEKGIPYIAMRYVEGEALSAKIQAARHALARGGSAAVLGPAAAEASSSESLPPAVSASAADSRPQREEIRRIVHLVEKTARALHVAHQAGLVHRDIKPGNIMVTREGEPVLLDFGMAQVADDALPTLTLSGALLGTPAYMAPEQIKGERDRIDARTDVFSLGVTLYECLTLSLPFSAATREQIYLRILQEEPTRPRRLNPRISREIEVVVATALDKNRDRRYPTAAALAEDLRRVREHEPIRARSAGPITRSRKWARRNPGRAVAMAAVLLIVLAGAALLVGQRIADERAAREGAAQAREEARWKSQEYTQGLQDLAPRRAQVAKLRAACLDSYAPTAERAALARAEEELAAEEARLERLLAEGREALERAFRLEAPYCDGQPSPATRAAFAEYFLGRFRERCAAGDLRGAQRQAKTVRAYDDAGRHEQELLGCGTLTVTVEPATAVVYLFRYESYEAVRRQPPVVPRLVPVPTAGVGRCRPAAWLAAGDFHPGDLCLVVTAVAEGSLAAQAGLTPGDLVIRLNGQPCGDGLFVTGVAADSPLARAAVKPLTRIESINGEAVESEWDWANAEAPRQATDRIRLVGVTEEIQQDRKAVSCAGPVALVIGAAPAEMTLQCLRAGEPIAVVVAAGKHSGLAVEVTAYPLVLSPANRIGAAETVVTDPGSYLLLLRREGFEDQRFPALVPRQGQATVKAKLLPAGTTPAGFVYVPPGPFLYGGDPEGGRAGPREVRVLPGFFIARKELASREYFSFLNDPATRRQIDLEKSTPVRFVPRQPGGSVLVQQDGERFVPGYGTMDTPVVGISWEDVQAYLRWRNEKAEVAGQKWRWDLPTEEEWEKAARGVDGRFFPWGDRFDHALTVGYYRKKGGLHALHGGFEPRDCSPYGLLDCAGSRGEWTKSQLRPESDMYVLRAASWGSNDSRYFRVAYRDDYAAALVSTIYGVRLVLRESP
ncbi:MAG: SUMF1/EgtB/PvdO family nonheme iron enzyme [Planctomycetes bacterium]|nr:SUMF1/EgtB/PvdO family nonheme iron enzyme [Planctomycetota bacterium]